MSSPRYRGIITVYVKSFAYKDAQYDNLCKLLVGCYNMAKSKKRSNRYWTAYSIERKYPIDQNGSKTRCTIIFTVENLEYVRELNWIMNELVDFKKKSNGWVIDVEKSHTRTLNKGKSPDDILAEKLLEIQKIEDPDLDGIHSAMDNLLCETLRQLGYTKSVDIFEKQEKWYG